MPSGLAEDDWDGGLGDMADEASAGNWSDFWPTEQDVPVEVDYGDGNYGSPTPEGVGGTYGGSGGGGGDGALAGLFKSLGLTKKDGSVNWAQLLGLGGAAASMMGGSTYSPRSPAQLLASLPSNAPNMAPLSMTSMRAGNQLPTMPAASMPSPIQPGTRYAVGGPVMGDDEVAEGAGPLSAVFQGPGLVPGTDSGQSDGVPAQLSPGEYVFDAESVSMLGDGNNAAGAQRLDELRQSLRAHKRDAPDDDIAPPAKGPLEYLTGGAV